MWVMTIAPVCAADRAGVTNESSAANESPIRPASLTSVAESDAETRRTGDLHAGDTGRLDREPRGLSNDFVRAVDVPPENGRLGMRR